MRKRDIIIIALTLTAGLLFCIWLVKPQIFKIGEEKMGAFFKRPSRIREPFAAKIGFYPSDAESLKRTINSLLESAPLEKIPGEIVALIVPHAGYQYSGGVAAYAYRQIYDKNFDCVIIIGPSHRAYIDGISIGEEDYYNTPLGLVPLNGDIALELNKAGKKIFFDSTAHAQEHSVEVQVPFLQATLKDFKIVPIVMGNPTWSNVEELAKALVEVVKEKSILIIASSDFSHYYPYDQAVKMDKIALENIEKMDAKALYQALEEGRCELCGAGPVLAVLEAAKKLGADKIKVLKYANSGDITGDKSGVVGYASIAIYKGTQTKLKSEKWLGEKEQKELLKIARETLKSYLQGKGKPQFEAKYRQLKEKYGAFVTLEKNEQLRGCIGHIVADKPLLEIIPEMAIASATQDPRFPPVSYDELKDIKIEISVLSKPVRVKDPNEIIVGRDGLIIRKGFYSGLLLPQVPVEWGWSKEEFLTQVCLKAGLPGDAWKEKDAELQRFSAQVFKEE